jgi:phenylpyruvate tautomerase PptA (4-oxalocrotonate tautomerase family)
LLVTALCYRLADKQYLVEAMERRTILSEKQKVAAVVTDIDVSSLNRYRPKIVVTREEFKASTEEDIANAGEFS